MRHYYLAVVPSLLATAGLSAASVEQCRLYIAESTIPGAGLGIFTGIDLEENSTIAEPDIIVPFSDFNWHQPELDFHMLWNEYSWQAAEMFMETDFVQGSALVIGTGCMPNCNFALTNAYEGKPEYNHAGLKRKDYGVTGFTGFHNQKMITLRDIPAGGEIFVSYGENWFLSREEEMSTVPFEKNFVLVDEFLFKFKNISLKYQTSNNPDFTKDLWNVVQAEARVIETRSGNALPFSFEDMQSAQAIGSADSRLPYSIRTIEWLNDHGRCMDNIRPGKSTIPDAGRGAFASRLIPKGGLVAPGPVLHIPNSTVMTMYDIDPLTGERDASKEPGKQLIVNYCFGHSKSTLLLCPYTSPSAYINHSRKPNARVVWADETTPNHNAEWLKEDVDFLKKQEAIGLSLNFEATRDIQPGEEVFIDYGREWEAAWKKYVIEWKPPADADEFVSAITLQQDLSTPLRTMIEQVNKPYPQNIVFYCHTYSLKEEEYVDEWSLSEAGYWEYEWDEDDTFADEENEYSAWRENYIFFSPKYPCNILDRSEESSFDDDGNYIGHTYSVLLLAEDEVATDEVWVQGMAPAGEKHVIRKIPRAAIDIRDKMYTKNEFLSGSFRHPMMIPGDIFPKTWINLRS